MKEVINGIDEQLVADINWRRGKIVPGHYNDTFVLFVSRVAGHFPAAPVGLAPIGPTRQCMSIV